MESKIKGRLSFLFFSPIALCNVYLIHYREAVSSLFLFNQMVKLLTQY